MKVGPVAKIDKKNNDTISENCDVIAIFQFMANLEQSGNQIPDA